MATFGKIGATPLFKHWSAADYVRSGLIALWDGTENNGFGNHDPDATLLTNLVGGNSLTPVKSSYTITPSSIHLVSNGMYADVPGINDANNSGEWSVQIVAKNNSTSTSGAQCLFTLAGYGGNSSHKPQLYDANGVNTCGCNAINIGTAAGWTTLLGIAPLQIRTITLTIDSKSSSANTYYACYRNDILTKSGGRAKSANAGTYTERISIACFNPANSSQYWWMRDIEIFSVRVYLKVLSASDISHNYTVDKLRFNLT